MKQLKLFTLLLLVALVSVQCVHSVKQPYRKSGQVVRITAPDTVEMKVGSSYKTVKLIGVAVPTRDEVMDYGYSDGVSRAERNRLKNEWYRARDYLSTLISKGDVLNYEQGFHGWDKGNTLAYLYLPDHRMVNLELIRKGYAYPIYHPDNNRYEPLFRDALTQARESNAGLYAIWKDRAPDSFSESSDVKAVYTGKDDEYTFSRNEVVVMTFNVENLFDTSHDYGKSDYTYLPMAEKQKMGLDEVCRGLSGYHGTTCRTLDWSPAVVAAKMRNLAGAVQAANSGRGPDILILQEVENFDILKQWRDGYLARLGYHTMVLIEGKDYRGIDIAVLARLPLGGAPVLHEIPFHTYKSSRGILEVPLQLPDGTTLTVLGLHFPSQASDSSYRVDAFRHLNRIATRKKGMVVAAGDCNITSTEDESKKIFDKYGKRWIVSHRVQKMSHEGTTYYPPTKNWSYFDVILVSDNMAADGKASWKVVPESVKIANSYSQQVAADGTPQRFEFPAMRGVSDHWPVELTIEKRTVSAQ